MACDDPLIESSVVFELARGMLPSPERKALGGRSASLEWLVFDRAVIGRREILGAYRM